MFHEKGLGGIVSSWIGTGQNLPISADQLQNVLHSGALQQAAQSAGIDPSQLVSMMTTFSATHCGQAYSERACARQ
jgi:uncharacterized protein YidB (DUF937 family)